MIMYAKGTSSETYTFSSSIKLRKLGLLAIRGDGNYTQTVTIGGSNDGSNYTNILTFTKGGNKGFNELYTIPENSFQYYKLTQTKSDGTGYYTCAMIMIS